MESTTREQTVAEALAEGLDRLGEKVDRATQVIAHLRKERTELRERCEAYRHERQRLLETAEVGDTAELLRMLDRVAALRDENRALLAERNEVARRLSALIDKVDLLEGDS
jgi:FtsZ-binding cell division protein ZapB